MPKPGTVTSVTDTVPDTVFLDTELDTLDMEVTDSDMPVVMEVTVLDTAMVDTVARDPLMLKPMPGTAVDTDMEVMATDTVTDMRIWPWIQPQIRVPLIRRRDSGQVSC